MRKDMFPNSGGPLSVNRPEPVPMGNTKSFREAEAGKAGPGINREVYRSGGQHGLVNPTPPKKGGPMGQGF
jgi:hypothetical protein